MRTAKDMRPLQREAARFAYDSMKCIWLLGMGAGKTGAALQLIERLMNHEYAVGRIIVIAPKLVCNTVWEQEAREWAETKGLRIASAMCSGVRPVCKETGKQLPSPRDKAVMSDHDILLINPAKLGWLRKNHRWRWDGVVIDESSKFKSQASKRWLYLADGKLGILRYLRFILLLTGTPMPQGYLDLWAQIYLVDRGKRLGKDITMFRRQHFDQVHKTGMAFSTYALRDGHEDIIKDKVADVCFAKEVVLPTKEPIMLTEWLEPSPSALKRYRELQRESLIEINGVEIETPNAGSATNKLLQMCNGFIYDEENIAHHIHDAKVERLKEIVEDNAGENMLVCYNFKEDLRRLQEAFPQAVLLGKAGKEVEPWNRREIPILLCHPARAGHGLNMQYGGSLQIWYGLTWSLENYLQMNKRLDRAGQTEAVRILHLAMRGMVDQRLLAAIRRKFKTQKDFIDFVIRAHN